MTLETVADRRLHPATFLTGALKQLPQYALGLPAAVGFMSESGLDTILLLALGGILAAAAGAWLHWRRFRYGLGAREIVIESGILHRKRRVIPFDRIQDIDIEQGLLARAFGMAKVRIETGGSAKDEGNLDSVALDEAHRLRELLRRGARGEVHEGPWGAAALPAEDEPLIFHMPLGRVLLAGLFNFSLVFLAVIFGALEYAEPVLGVDPLKMEWIEPARALAAQATWGVTALGLAFLLVLGLIAGVLRTLARDFRFRLTRSTAGLRRRRGLFTLTEAVVPLRRVQVSIIRSGAVARLFGWHGLEFQTLNADAGQAGNQVAVPFGRMDELTRVLREVRPAPLPEDSAFVRVSKRHILRQSIRWTAFLILPIAAAAVFFPPAALLLLALPLAAGAAALQWKHHRYCVAADALYVRHGFLTRRLWIIPFERIQTLAMDQGPLQRRLGLASLTADTAGASLLRMPVIANLPAEIAAALAAALLTRHKAARARLKLAA
ncbi:MAG TPA: PH domain-containing protein [Allosphingosinicella sp.]|uniref:PH domain-containing protein n=1 Tax=Allosphingosinicella sp. TaxID=2823234 RepID=UPI002EDAE4AE